MTQQCVGSHAHKLHCERICAATWQQAMALGHAVGQMCAQDC